ncbi:MAG: DegV family protein [Parasporobacterium sp.]|nr:DegV family protein [Parasporobacterium sp.]
MSFVIIPDCGCSMTDELRSRFNIPDYVKGHVLFPDGVEHDTDLDWKEISADDYFRSMVEKKAIYRSGTAGLDNTVMVYEKILQEGKDIIGVTLSSALSGNYSLAAKAREILKEKYPEREIFVVDSKRYSGAIAAMIAKAEELRLEGKSVAEVAEWLEKNKNRYHQMGPMDDLNFLCRTGRINNFKAFFGTLVGVNALGDLNQNGLTDVLGKVKGKPAALKATLEYIKRTIEEPEKQIVFISHSYRHETAEELKRMITEEVKPKEIVMTRIDMCCGANVGPGLAAVFYYGKEISENLEEEKKIMEGIIK